MIVEPDQRVADFAKAGADIISVHVESKATTHLDRVIHQVPRSFEAFPTAGFFYLMKPPLLPALPLWRVSCTLARLRLVGSCHLLAAVTALLWSRDCADQGPGLQGGRGAEPGHPALVHRARARLRWCVWSFQVKPYTQGCCCTSSNCTTIQHDLLHIVKLHYYSARFAVQPAAAAADTCCSGEWC